MLHQFHQRAFSVLASLRLTLVVLILMIACLFVGMFWDQTLTLEEHLSAFEKGSSGYHIFRFFELNDVFHSWWFSMLVLALAINLIACSFVRLPPIWIDIHNPPWPPTDSDLRKMTHKKRFLATNKELVEQSIRAAFPNLVATQSGKNGEDYFFAERQKYGRTGVYIIHISLLMIMFGSIAATNFGVDGMLVIGEGESSRIAQIKGPGGVPYQYDIGFDVRCVDFRLKTFTDGSAMEFESDLAIYDPPNTQVPVVHKTIRVNDPLQYKGFTFYQSSYQPIESQESVNLAVAPHGRERTRYKLAIGEALNTSDGTKVVPLEVFKDYAGLGEAVRIQMIEPNTQPSSFLVFRQYPDFDPLVRRGKWDVYYFGADQMFATGVSVGKVPGVSLVFAGFIVMFIGLYMAFIMNHRRYLARIKKVEEGYEVLIAGQARRHLYSFKEEWKEIESKIEGQSV